jgi:hypothetical protein
MAITEQMTITFQCTENGSLKLHTINGQEQPSWEDGPDMVDFLNQMNHAGWTISKHSRGTKIVLERAQPKDTRAE